MHWRRPATCSTRGAAQSEQTARPAPAGTHPLPLRRYHRPAIRRSATVTRSPSVASSNRNSPARSVPRAASVYSEPGGCETRELQVTAYVIGHITVKDAERWAEYRSRVPATLEPWRAEV